MSQFNYFGSGNPVNVPSPGDSIANYFDTLNNTLWLSSGNGWAPSSVAAAKGSLLAQTAATQANLLTFAVPKTGLYRIDGYASQQTSTNGTLPTISVAWTEGDASTSNTATVVTGTATTGAGQYDQGSIIINAKVGTNIVLSSASAATLTYNVKTRVEFLG